MKQWIRAVCIVMLAATAHAQQADTKKPMEVASDTLEVLQNEQKAIFVGNVIATQGNINMRAERMVVFYRETPSGKQTTSSAVGGEKGIYRVEAYGNVIFTTPTETGQGDQAVYNVDTETVDLMGNVTLTRDKNVLKGTSLTYNMATGRSILNSSSGQTGGRVRGLFIPNQSGAK
ncbi:MAG: lipopolysaccharide transport periplasmic protein LptA [Rickettsiales bacterium]